MNQQVEHLYIHIPFCSHICTYCDFKRTIGTNDQIELYLKKIISQVKNECHLKQFKTIYLGGGTPNVLNDKQLDDLLSFLKNYLKDQYEFTIECNPEFVTSNQAKIFSQNKINRVSLGVQTNNEVLLKKLHRQHQNIDVINAIKYLREQQINNISCDYIYGFNELNLNDLKETFKFIKNQQISHLSFYALEIKENAILKHQQYVLNNEHIEAQLIYIIDQLKALGYQRYEVANWSISNQYESEHNKAYWQSLAWKAIGYGAYGFENRHYYHYKGNVNNFKKEDQLYDDLAYYQHIVIMGLRMKEGLNLDLDHHLKAYQFFEKQFKSDPLIKKEKNRVFYQNLNLLDNFLIKII